MQDIDQITPAVILKVGNTEVYGGELDGTAIVSLTCLTRDSGLMRLDVLAVQLDTLLGLLWNMRSEFHEQNVRTNPNPNEEE